jgi:hypothetical protein
MKAFFMLAGSVMTTQTLQAIQSLLQAQGIASNLAEQELLLQCPASFELRYGFEHELIVVGNCPDQATLEQQARWLSGLFKQLQLTHDFELYDTANRLILDIQYRTGENH